MGSQRTGVRERRRFFHWDESRKDRWFRHQASALAVLVLVVMAAIIASLLYGALPAFATQGWGLFRGDDWDPVSGHFSALPALYGTIVTSAIALALAVPVSFFTTFFLTQICPKRLRTPLTAMIELLAGIPSIIYGMWGLFVLAPLLAEHVQPLLGHWFGHVWLLGRLLSGPPIGIGLLPAALILSLMITPFITSVMIDVFNVVPTALKEGGYGIGATTWEVTIDIIVPYTRVAIFGGIMLGLGRALGETMAVTFMIGNANRIGPELFDSGNSIASVIANEFAEASDPQHAAVLTALGLLLFALTFVVLALARLMIRRVQRLEGGK